MKSRLILSIFLFLLSIYSYGQPAYLFGVKGGLNVSTLGQDPLLTPKLGYNVGLYYSSRYYQELGVQLELLLSQQGARYDSYSNLKLNYTYLNVPVIANIYFIEDAAIECGLQVGYLLKATQVDEGEKFDISEDVKSWDFSGVVGISYNKTYGSIGIRYVLGINNVNNASRSSEIKHRNNVLQLYVAKTITKSQ